MGPNPPRPSPSALAGAMRRAGIPRRALNLLLAESEEGVALRRAVSEALAASAQADKEPQRERDPADPNERAVQLVLERLRDELAMPAPSVAEALSRTLSETHPSQKLPAHRRRGLERWLKEVIAAGIEPSELVHAAMVVRNRMVHDLDKVAWRISKDASDRHEH